MIQLNGKHIVIVGGSRGLGAASAVMAAKAGAKVTITYRANEEAAKKVLQEIESGGGKAFAVQAELSLEGDMVKALDRAVEKFGAPHGLVVSAGIFEGPARIEDMSLEFWNRTMVINVTGTFLAVKAAVRHIRKAQIPASIVLYTSTAGQRGSEDYSAYATSKGAVILFMRSMARELGPERIRVNCVAPAWTETDMARPSLDAIGRDKLKKEFVLRKIGHPDDIAGATVYLLSDLANHVTGITLTVDGGIDMRG
jgi:NAD(P)-dependent dehydrogenase (short-subunit alcohol dehydrogenase family)